MSGVESVVGVMRIVTGEEEAVTGGVDVVTAGVAGVAVRAQEFLICECFELSIAGIEVPRSFNPTPPVSCWSLVSIVSRLQSTLRSSLHHLYLEYDVPGTKYDQDGHEAHNRETDDPED